MLREVNWRGHIDDSFDKLGPFEFGMRPVDALEFRPLHPVAGCARGRTGQPCPSLGCECRLSRLPLEAGCSWFTLCFR